METTDIIASVFQIVNIRFFNCVIEKTKNKFTSSTKSPNIPRRDVTYTMTTKNAAKFE